jgi:hypothetical protein
MVGYRASPVVVGEGLAADGRETLQYIEGHTHGQGPWSDDALTAIAHLLRQLHDASEGYDLRLTRCGAPRLLAACQPGGG